MPGSRAKQAELLVSNEFKRIGRKKNIS